ncbi:LOW QUALITY PROTEIN: tyrosine-protein phosphatase non-receptor type 9-like [Cotesia typhae]|uniref:LOW QUALITY PROTEIN: tyrosine-protein phosphatase non-receptor type 9-like n=1 Tax=Cotesia typhae TaxID=2053667 RepID=UPI003D6921B3
MKLIDCESFTLENLWAKANQPNFSSLVWDEHHRIVSTEESGTWKAQKLQTKLENRDKNWSSLVPCWDHSRVFTWSYDLRISDYIHANYVSGFEDEKKFICTQAPRMNTVKTFWTMVWNENSRIIVMLINLTTNNELQCYPYWHPAENGMVVIGDYKIRTLRKLTLAHITMTDLFLTKKYSGKSRQIFHFSFTDWTTDGTPGSPSEFYEFVRKVNQVRLAVARGLKTHRQQPAPIVVYCTTGIRRTGIFCTVDCALFQVISTLQISLPKIVRRIRQQRHSSVIVPEQYFFCYRVVLHFITIMKKKKNNTRNKILPNSGEIEKILLTD